MIAITSMGVCGYEREPDGEVCTGLLTIVQGEHQVVCPRCGAIHGALSRGGCPFGPHRGPEGPNEDVSVCLTCSAPSHSMRPEGETYGHHAPDCSAPRRHPGHCPPGGPGHPPADVIRGYWPCRHCRDETTVPDDPKLGLCRMCDKAGRS